MRVYVLSSDLLDAMPTDQGLVVVKRPDGTHVWIHDMDLARGFLKLLPGVGAEVKKARVAVERIRREAHGRPVQRALAGAATCSRVGTDEQEIRLLAPEAAACRQTHDGCEVVPPKGDDDAKPCTRISGTADAEARAHAQADGPGADSGAGCQRSDSGMHPHRLVCSRCGESWNHSTNTECVKCGAKFPQYVLSGRAAGAWASRGGYPLRMVCSICGESRNHSANTECFNCGAIFPHNALSRRTAEARAAASASRWRGCGAADSDSSDDSNPLSPSGEEGPDAPCIS